MWLCRRVEDARGMGGPSAKDAWEAEGREARYRGEFETPCGVRGRALGECEYFADLMNHFHL